MSKKPPCSTKHGGFLFYEANEETCWLCGVAFLLTLFPVALDDYNVHSDGREAIGVVDDWKVFTGRGGTFYYIQYGFVIPSQQNYHSQSWVAIPYACWTKTKITHRICIKYLAVNPDDNRPVEPAENPLLQAILIFCMSFGLLSNRAKIIRYFAFG